MRRRPRPERSTSGSAFYTAIEKPVLMPLMYLTIALSPLVWLMNWLSYLNGSAHVMNKLSSFGGTETWEQIDFATKFQPQASPAVLARGMLGMMRYDATNSRRDLRPDASGCWRPGLDDEARGQRTHPRQRSRGKVNYAYASKASRPYRTS